MHCAKYLGLGMRYKAGICTIAIIMKRTLKHLNSVHFATGLILTQNHEKP